MGPLKAVNRFWVVQNGVVICSFHKRSTGREFVKNHRLSGRMCWLLNAVEMAIFNSVYLPR